MKEVVLEAQVREVSSNHNLKQLRAEGSVPAVFYGKGEKSLPMFVSARKFSDTVHGGGNVLVTLNFGTMTKTAIVKEVQRDVLTEVPVHIDFQAVSLKEKIEVSVPLHVVGIAPGVKLGGGIMEHILRDVRVSCLPTDIPEVINVDVSRLELNHSILIKDLPPIAGIEFLSDPQGIIVNVVAPTAIEETPAPGAAAAGAAAAGEPEVIAKGKKEEGAEGAAPAKGAPAAKGAEKK